MSFYNFARTICSIVATRILYRYEIEGLENITNREKGQIICSNHRSNFDPIFLGVRIKRPIYFMGKEELAKKPIIGKILIKVGLIPIKRGKADVEGITKVIDRLKSGDSVTIFIEGTRSKDGELQRPKSGMVAIANKTKADVAPVAIYWEGKLRFRSKVYVKYGKIIENSELEVNGGKTELKEKSEYAMSKIRELYEELKEKAKN